MDIKPYKTDDSRDVITSALDVFDGDVDKLISAIRAEALRRSSRPKNKPEPTSEVIISVNNLKKTYKVGKTKIEALNGVTLDIHKGDFGSNRSEW